MMDQDSERLARLEKEISPAALEWERAKHGESDPTIDVQPLREIGKNRPRCVETVRVAVGLITNTAQHRAYEAKRLGFPINECGRRGDFTVDGRVMCRTHAQAAALAYILNRKETK